MPVHPLIFEPILRPKVWGGDRLAALLGKKLPTGVAIGESLECADLPSAASVVAAGPARGRSLPQLVREWGADLLGRAAPVDGRFPLLIKFLDARQPLSIQVHPGAAALAAGVRSADIKHEAWYVLEADADAVIYQGVRPGVTRERLEAACAQVAAAGDAADGRGLHRAAADEAIIELLHTTRPKVDHSQYCPGGTIHALGGGLVVAEVQTPSDVTYRLYDWGRSRPAGDAGLHVADALRVAELTPAPAAAMRRSHVGGLFTTVTRLVDCAAFRMEKVRFVEGMQQEMPYAELVIWIVTEGRGAIDYEGGPPQPFGRGDVVVLPAALKRGRVRTETNCTWLEVTIPPPSDLAGFPRPTAESLRADDSADAAHVRDGTIPLNIRRGT